MEAWTSTVQLKSSTRYRVSGRGVESVHKKKKKKKVGLDCSVIDPFETVESKKETLINMIPKQIPSSDSHSGL